MHVGICWPTPGVESMWMDPALMAMFKERTRATHIRCDFDHRRGVDDCLRQARQINEGGFKVQPILAFDHKNPSVMPYSEFCAEFVKQAHVDVVEVSNEPSILGKMEPARFAQIFTEAARMIRDTGVPTRILIPAEKFETPNKPMKFFTAVSKLVPRELYDGIAIHPYRNPKPPTWTKFGTREREHMYYMNHAPGKAVWVTEVGWDLRDGVDVQDQAAYIYQELTIQEQLGVEATFIYAYTEAKPPNEYMFGITDYQLNPRPACGAILQFQQERAL